MEPLQAHFFGTARFSMSAGQSVVRKHGRQEENSTAVKMACRGKMVNENKAVQEEWGLKHPQWDVNNTGNMIYLALDVNTQSKCTLSVIVNISPKGSLAWLCAVGALFVHSTISVDVHKKIFICLDLQSLSLFTFWIWWKQKLFFVYSAMEKLGVCEEEWRMEAGRLLQTWVLNVNIGIGVKKSLFCILNSTLAQWWIFLTFSSIIWITRFSQV